MKLVGKILTVGLTLTMLAAMLCIGLTASADPVYTMRENNDTLSAKWTASTTAKATLDESNKLNAGNAAQLAFDSSSNEYGVAQQNYETYTEGVEADGIRFRAVADKAIKVRVAYWIFDKDVQYYWDVDFDTTPRVYTLNLADAASHTNPKPAYDGAHKLGGLILQYGIYGGDKQATLWFDELETFVGDAATGSEVIPVKRDPVYTMRESNDTLSDKWAVAKDGAAVPTLDEDNVLGSGNSVKITMDRTKQEYSFPTQNYNIWANGVEADGIRFRAVADKAINVRVTYWICEQDPYFDAQYYWDVDFDTTPREYTLNLADAKSYSDPKPSYSGARVFAGIILQYGRNGGDNDAVLWFDELETFVGDAATGSEVITVTQPTQPTEPTDPKPTEPTDPKPAEPTPAEIFEKAKKTVVNDFSNPEDIIFEWTGPIPDDGSVKIESENGGAKVTFKRSLNQYGIASTNYNPNILFTENHDGIAFTASAETPCEMRVAFVIGKYQQLYADVQLTTEPQQFVLFFKDMKGYDGFTKPDDLTKLAFHTMVFQVGRPDGETNLNGPDENVLHISGPISLFTVSNGENPENPGDNKPDDNKPNVPAGEAIPYAVAAVAVLSAAALAYVSRKQK